MVCLELKLKDERPVGLQVWISISGCIVVVLGAVLILGVLDVW